MNSYLVCLIFVAVIGIADGQDCKDGWKRHGHKCYKYIGKYKNNQDHKTGCSRLGGYLAEPTSQSENRFIKTLIRASSFIGFNDKKTEKHFVEDTSGKAPCYTNWYYGEPNDYRGREDCTIMLTNRDASWNDIDCNARRGTVCEYKIMHVVDNCKSGWKPYGRKCYKAFTEKKSKSAAERVCRKEDGYLAEPQSKEENHFISSLIKKHSYLGLIRRGPSRYSFMDRTGRHLSYKNWNRGEPNNAGRREFCVLMFTDGRWHDITCWRREAYVCEYQL